MGLRRKPPPNKESAGQYCSSRKRVPAVAHYHGMHSFVLHGQEKPHDVRAQRHHTSLFT